MSELKPCPCGGIARLLYVNGESYGLHNGEMYTRVECSSCSFNADDTDDWNTRAPQSEWISVATPPKNYQRVLIKTTNADGDPWVTIATYNGVKTGYLLAGGYKDKDVTGWMELPN